MAQKIATLFIDDIDGGAAEGTVRSRPGTLPPTSRTARAQRLAYTSYLVHTS